MKRSASSVDEMDASMEEKAAAGDERGVSVEAMDIGEEGSNEEEEDLKWEKFMTEEKDLEKRKKMIMELRNQYSQVRKYHGDKWKSFSVDIKAGMISSFRYPLDTVRAALAIIESGTADKATGPEPTVLDQKSAFEIPYEEHGGTVAFLKHLEEQKTNYNPKSNFPFFPILQSSGYGKSRLIDQIKKTKSHPNVVYLSFASDQAYPARNVYIEPSFKNSNRSKLESAFQRLFAATTQGLDQSSIIQVDDKNPEASGQTTNAETLFVIDEGSNLLDDSCADGINYFRCLRRAMVNYKQEHSACFFCVLATFASVSKIIPSLVVDDSSKDLARLKKLDEYRDPMRPFLLHEALGLPQNVRQEILSRPIEVCHESRNLLAMGRPLWKAYMQSDKNSQDMVLFARAKLLKSAGLTAELEARQLVAIAACRACLTISPESIYASSLVASHMATAVNISTDRHRISTSYPSEPVLALAGRAEMLEDHTINQRLFSQLTEYFKFGAVEKGHKGEVIVRILNLLAIDKCMEEASAGLDKVKEIPVRTFLSQFDREGASLSDELSTKGQVRELTDKQKRVLRQLGWEPESWLEEEAEKAGEIDDGVLDNGHVCFTHFVYLSRDQGDESKALITPALLRYAYRRGAAIVVESGRWGIDWLIPVRIKSDGMGGKEVFAALVGQDKNRIHDSLDCLTQGSNKETHLKVRRSYFLTSTEKHLFEKEKDWPTEWLSIFFAIGVDEIGVALAAQPIVNEGTKAPFPCMVLTGLGYTKLMDVTADDALRELRNFEERAPHVYKQRAPMTYGN